MPIMVMMKWFKSWELVRNSFFPPSIKSDWRVQHRKIQITAHIVL